MAVFYLRHPVHGVKVATSNLEVAHDEEHGWELFDPTEVTPRIASDNVMSRRRGRSKQVELDDDGSGSDQRGLETFGGLS